MIPNFLVIGARRAGTTKCLIEKFCGEKSCVLGKLLGVDLSHWNVV